MRFLNRGKRSEMVSVVSRYERNGIFFFFFFYSIQVLYVHFHGPYISGDH